MQQLGSFMQQLQAKNDDLKKRLATSEEKTKINQMIRDHEERGVSTLKHDRYQMGHVFEMLILPHLQSVHSCLLRESRLGYCRT